MLPVITGDHPPKPRPCLDCPREREAPRLPWLLQTLWPYQAKVSPCPDHTMRFCETVILEWQCLHSKNFFFVIILGYFFGESILCLSNVVRYIQVGNAVAVPVARALGYALGQAYQGLTTGSDPVFTLPEGFPKPTFWNVGNISKKRDLPSLLGINQIMLSYCSSSILCRLPSLSIHIHLDECLLLLP